MSASTLLTRPDRKAVRLLCEQTGEIFAQARIIDSLAVAQTLIYSGLVKASQDLETALADVDRIAENIKTELRRRMGN